MSASFYKVRKLILILCVIYDIKWSTARRICLKLRGSLKFIGDRIDWIAECAWIIYSLLLLLDLNSYLTSLYASHTLQQNSALRATKDGRKRSCVLVAAIATKVKQWVVIIQFLFTLRTIWPDHSWVPLLFEHCLVLGLKNLWNQGFD